jgi:hypothetical protein
MNNEEITKFKTIRGNDDYLHKIMICKIKTWMEILPFPSFIKTNILRTSWILQIL